MPQREAPAPPAPHPDSLTGLQPRGGPGDRLARELGHEGRANRLWLASLTVWLTVLIVTPISIWLAGESAFLLMANVGVLAQAAAVLLALAGCWPARRTATVSAITLAGTWGVERLGSTTGIPFGRYAYTGALQPQIGGVPLLIPLAWLMMLAPAWAAADALLAPFWERLRGWQRPLSAALAGGAFDACDLYLDPQIVARGLWVWESPGGYFGIPWVNFLGWWGAAALLTLLIRPADLPRRRLLVIYTLTWLFQAVGLGVFWEQPGPALVGFVGMGLFAGLAWRGEARR